MSNNRPNLVAGDAEGNPDPDTDHLVSGRVPGNGGTGYWTVSDGNLEPADPERAVNVEVSRSKESPVYDVTAWGAEGDGETDDREAIQDAIDAAESDGGGTVFFPAGHYLIDSIGGTDAEGFDYGIELKSNVNLEGVGEASLIDHPINPSTAIFASGITDFAVTDLKIDGGYHTTPQPDSDIESCHCLKIGERQPGNTSGTECKRFHFSGLKITGGLRHGIEVGGPDGDVVDGDRAWSGPGLVEDCIAIDGSGDDDFCLGGTVRDVTFRDCQSINKTRSGDWGSSGFEFDDGPRNCYFINCRCIDPLHDEVDGFVIGKMHSWCEVGNEDNYCVGCVADGYRDGFLLSTAEGHGGTVSGIEFIDCVAKNCHENPLEIEIRGGVTEDVAIRGGRYIGGVQTMYIKCQSSLDGLEIDCHTEASTREPGANVRLQPVDTGTISNIKIAGEHIEAAQYGVQLNPLNGGQFGEFDISNAEIRDNGARNIMIHGTASDYTGLGIIEDNDLTGGWDPSIEFDEDAIRQHIITRGNKGNPDWSPVVPTGVVDSQWYLDDGTNTSSGTKGKRVYDGSAWFDAWTA